MVYEDCKVGKAILCKDGRLRIPVKYPNGHKAVISYPKYLVEVYRDKYLADDETVDHIDGNPLNNDIANLQVLNRPAHATLDAKRIKPQRFKCPMCGEYFTLSCKKLNNAIQNRKKGKAGPFCSKSCAGKYGAKVQHGEQSVLPVVLIQPSYTTHKHSGAFMMETHKVNTANSGKPSDNTNGNPELG